MRPSRPILSAAIIALGMLLSINECAAAEVGEGAMCGGIAGIACKNGLWCEPEPGN